MQKLETGIEVPTNSDPYNLTADLAKMGLTANVAIPVANAAARDALTKKPGLMAARLDVPGAPIETWDGTSWTRQGPKVLPSAESYVGAALPANAFTAGVFAPIIQAGTKVLSTDLSGYIAFDYPTPFPNGVVGLIVTNGDSAQGRAMVFAAAGSPFNQTRQTAFISVVDGNGTPKNKVNVRFNYIAIGF